MNIQEFQDLLNETGHALRNDEAAVKDMHRMIMNHEEKGKRPFYMYCAATGKRVGMSQTPVYQKRLAKFQGSLVSMFVNYKSREGRKDEAVVVVATEEPAIEAEVLEVVELEATPVVEVDEEAAKREQRNARRRELRALKKAEQAAA